MNMVKFVLKKGVKKSNGDEQMHESDLNELCYIIRCPICPKSIATNKSSQVRSDGYPVDYCLISNFQRHIRKHIQKSKESAAQKKARSKGRAKSSTSANHRRSPSGKTSIKAAKVSKQRPRRRSQCEEDSEQLITSSDSDCNVEVEKEMQKNFENQDSDLDVDSFSESYESFSSQHSESSSCPPSMQQTQKMRKIDSQPDQNKDLGKIAF